MINYLILKADEISGLKPEIMWLLQYTNTPSSIEFIMAEFEIANKKNNRYIWHDNFSSNWDKNHFRGSMRTLSKDCLNKLKSIWENEDNSEYLRKISFDLWTKGLTKKDLKILKSINQNSPLSHSAILARVELNDYEVTDRFIQKLSNNSRLFYIAHKLWGNEIKNAFEDYIKLHETSLNSNYVSDVPLDTDELFTSKEDNTSSEDDSSYFDSYSIVNFLSNIPINESSQLLSKYWDKLRFDKLFIQLCFYINSSKSLELAKFAIDDIPKNVTINVFEHFWFDFLIDGRKNNFRTESHFNGLIPYLNLFDDSELRELVEYAERMNLSKWGEKNLINLLEDDVRRIFYPTDEELVQDLISFKYPENEIRIFSWLKKFKERGDSNKRIMKVLKDYLKEHKDEDDLLIAIKCIKYCGSREYLSALDIFVMDENMIQRKNDIELYIKYYSLD